MRRRRVPGVVDAQRFGKTAMVVGSSFRSVERGLAAMAPRWKTPKRPRELEVEREIREGAELRKVIEEHGDLEDGFAKSSSELAETYLTQYASQVPIETETAIADVDGDEVTVWASTQAPFRARERVARHARRGGGQRPHHRRCRSAAALASRWGPKRRRSQPGSPAPPAGGSSWSTAGRTSSSAMRATRKRWSPTSAAVWRRTAGCWRGPSISTRTRVTAPRRPMTSRMFGPGSFRSPMPARHGTMRGTSFVQTCFAVESHTDMLARGCGIDPVTFRKNEPGRRRVRAAARCRGEMIGYREQGVARGPRDRVRHLPPRRPAARGGRRRGRGGSKHRRGPGRAARRRLRHRAGHQPQHPDRQHRGRHALGSRFCALRRGRTWMATRATTRSMSDYRIPRFSDVPPIGSPLPRQRDPGRLPRGCGELPVVPTIGAIANAVYDAIGLRFHTLPMTPERVLAGLRES